LLEQELEPNDGEAAIVEARVQLSEGTNSVLDVGPGVTDVVASLDGGTPLAEVIDAVADRLDLSVRERRQLNRDAVEAVRELLELGALAID
jgi:hypothetical protein